VLQRLAIAVVAGGLASACGDADCCSPFAPVYYAVAYGTVTRDGLPASGILVDGQVFTSACPASGTPTSDARAESDGSGAYRLLLSSSSPAEGQCLRLTLPGVAPVLQTLTGMPFSAQASVNVRDSVQINLDLP
jgi:hypothetical protein